MTDRRKSLKKGNDRHRFQVELLVEEIWDVAVLQWRGGGDRTVSTGPPM